MRENFCNEVAYSESKKVTRCLIYFPTHLPEFLYSSFCEIWSDGVRSPEIKHSRIHTDVKAVTECPLPMKHLTCNELWRVFAAASLNHYR